jgi:SAM-dependent methyltransferase
MTVDYQELTKRQRGVWASGDFGVVAPLTQPAADRLVAGLGLEPGLRVLDVATGSGNAAVTAADHGTEVVGVDYVPKLLERARERVAAEGLPVWFVEGDAQALPFADEEFDVALSVYGVMFAPDQQAAADELLRVTCPGGTVALASWTPDGFIGQVFKTLGKYLPPPDGVKSPALWGTRARLAEMFGPDASQVKCETRMFNFRYRSADHFLHVFQNFYGPVLKAFDALDPGKQEVMHNDLHALVVRMNRARDGSMVVASEYLEVVITKR